jgi:uncharacterized membrane protein SpoIIM required for sporulation
MEFYHLFIKKTVICNLIVNDTYTNEIYSNILYCFLLFSMFILIGHYLYSSYISRKKIEAREDHFQLVYYYISNKYVEFELFYKARPVAVMIKNQIQTLISNKVY